MQLRNSLCCKNNLKIISNITYNKIHKHDNNNIDCMQLDTVICRTAIAAKNAKCDNRLLPSSAKPNSAGLRLAL